MILPTPRLNVHPTPNEIQVAAAELDRLIFKNQKQEERKKIQETVSSNKWQSELRRS
jgi:hypothetical protein